MKFFNLELCLASTLFLSLHSFAGDKAGGGGDATEMRVNEIRADILSWIERGGSNALELDGITHSEYNAKMTQILQPMEVVVGFVEDDKSTEEEKSLIIDGTPKTCRGFISKEDSRPHILCHISRFEKTSEANQYRLIHHEYAGLVRLEKNDGAASDYYISEQLTNNLVPVTLLKLAVKENGKAPVQIDSRCSVSFGVNPAKLPGGYVEAFEKSGYQIVKSKSRAAIRATFSASNRAPHQGITNTGYATLTHKQTNFTVKYRFLGTVRQIDPRKDYFESRMNSSENVEDYAHWKDLLENTEYHPVMRSRFVPDAREEKCATYSGYPSKCWNRNLKIMTCTEFYGKKVLL